MKATYPFLNRMKDPESLDAGVWHHHPRRRIRHFTYSLLLLLTCPPILLYLLSNTHGYRDPSCEHSSAPSWYDAFPLSKEKNPFNNTNSGLDTIPQYVLEYAPYVHLSSSEGFWPARMENHLQHVFPTNNYQRINDSSNQQALTTRNLDKLNVYGHYGQDVFLTSRDDVESKPEWLNAKDNVPLNSTKRQLQDADDANSGKSAAPAIMILVEKADGILDAFWFFFYSFNQGNVVFGRRWGNHVGDWEHTMVRFQNGTPKAIYYSEHSFGSAYAYHTVEKIGARPVIYSARGTHAMYATAGQQPYVLPLGLLKDVTDRGPLWDLTKNMLSFQYTPEEMNSAFGPPDMLTQVEPQPDRSNLRPLHPSDPLTPVDWFHYNGRWGDKSYPLRDKRQYGVVGEFHYVDGPQGPRFKNLARRGICQSRLCRVREVLVPNEYVEKG